MSEDFLPFHTFSDPQIANDFAEKLKSAGINFRIEKVPQILDSTIVGTTSDSEIVIKLNRQEFNKAHEYFEGYYEEEINNIDNSYFLFEMSNSELYEILSKPDEWGYLNYKLAQRILTTRNQNINEEDLRKLKENRNDELGKPEKADIVLYVISYLFISTAFLSFISPIFIYSDLSFLFVLISFFVSRHIAKNKKILPDGQLVYSYEQKDRQHAKFLMYLALTVFIAAATKFLLLSFN